MEIPAPSQFVLPAQPMPLASKGHDGVPYDHPFFQPEAKEQSLCA